MHGKQTWNKGSGQEYNSEGKTWSTGIWYMFSVYSIAGTVAKNKQASDWVGVR